MRDLERAGRLAPRLCAGMTAKYKGSGRWKDWGTGVKIGAVDEKNYILLVINSYR